MNAAETLTELETVGEPKVNDELSCALFLVLCGPNPLLEMPPVILEEGVALTLRRGSTFALHGEAPHLQLSVADPHVSDPHCRITVRDGELRVEDLGSRNGTQVEGQPVRSQTVAPGSCLMVGRTAFVLRLERSDLLAGVSQTHDLPAELRTQCLTLKVAFSRLTHIANTTLPVFLSGETGTGKEISARSLHELSGRTGAFVAINCGALPEHLVESELFGYKRGAFSGAQADRKGLVRAAHGGTLFLDEIGDLPPEAQVKLLRVLQERVVSPLGSAAPEPIDFRLVAATHHDLPARVASGDFRSDLWARLRGFELRMPGLRERREDLGLLVAALLRRHAGARASQLRFDRRAVELLLAHEWPLNVRELDRLVEVVVNLVLDEREIRGDLIDSLLAKPVAVAPTKRKADPEQVRAQLDELLRAHEGNVTAVARELGHTRMQIHRWMKRFGISPEVYRPSLK
ncbi:MAG: sigma 54-interacting transcriptional regulator [Myxococcales bacterium]|nr:sigma 54-interacting transcriptional regulator [Myxococcales bacterium]